MTPRRFPIYPFLLAVFPAIQLAAGNPGEYNVTDLLTVVAAILATLGVTAIAIRLALPQRLRPLLPVLLTTLVAWGFLYVPLYNRLQQASGGRVPSLLPAAVGALVTGTVIAGLARRDRHLPNLHRFLGVFAGLLVLSSLVNVVVEQVHGRRQTARSPLAHQLGRPLRRTPHPERSPVARPDVYVIVLDMYAGPAVLRDRYGFDDTYYTDSLAALGFFVPRIVRSNYNQSRYSIPSLLNFAHVTGIVRDADRSADVALSYYLLRHDRTTRFLRSLGYTVVFFPSSWWPGTSDHAQTDIRFDAWQGAGAAGQLARSDLRRHLRARTPLSVVDLSGADLHHIRSTFEGLKRVPDMAGPTLAIAHVLLPHTPMIASAQCQPRAGRLPPDSAEARRVYVEQYLDQVQCANRLTLDLVTSLLRTSRTPPIILLQGDHGATSVEPLSSNPHVPSSSQEARAQFETFGAYYLPYGGARSVGTDITLVNLMRDILGYYFGLDTPRAADTLHYLVGSGTGVRIVPVPFRLLGRAP